MSGKVEFKFGSRIYNLSNSKNLFLIAGPCVIESEAMTLSIARQVKAIAEKLKLQFIFKASYKKANRTSGGSFRSIGVQKALEILGKVRDKIGVPVLTDVHSEIEVSFAEDYVDVIQIPAFLSRQTDLLEAAGETGKVVNIKKGQFLAPEDMKYQIEKVASTGNKKILVTERGTTFGYNNLVVDMRGIAIMKRFGYPVVFDATHSVQMPSKDKGKSGGSPEFIEPLSKAAAAVGINGLFLETHPNPKKSLSDAGSMLPLNKLEALLKKVLIIHNAQSEKSV